MKDNLNIPSFMLRHNEEVQQARLEKSERLEDFIELLPTIVFITAMALVVMYWWRE